MSRYQLSELHLKRAEITIPLGSQTFSKSRTQYPVGISPLYIERAKGCHVWDIDGNKYIDLVSALAAVTLGYGDSRVNRSVRKQIKKGVIFSLPGILEAEVSELICEMVPSAEMVRFGKNGTDATSAAVRLARAFTGRDHVAVCGYHGWQDWFIGSTTRNKGVPESVSALTHKFTYNDLDSLQQVIDSQPEVACVVMEPMNSTYPAVGFLEGVRKLTKDRGIVLIFDETITGFRFSRGGAQELFDVKPDLSTFGKGLANGFPLSAVTGRREIMQEMEEIFFSGTFGGELLSLAAAKAVLDLHEKDEVAPRLHIIGNSLRERVEGIIRENNLESYLQLTGHPSWIFLNWNASSDIRPEVLKTYFMQEMMKYGVIILNTHNVTLSMLDKDIESILRAYSRTLASMSRLIASGMLEEALEVPPLTPLFKIR